MVMIALSITVLSVVEGQLDCNKTSPSHSTLRLRGPEKRSALPLSAESSSLSGAVGVVEGQFDWSLTSPRYSTFRLRGLERHSTSEVEGLILGHIFGIMFQRASDETVECCLSTQRGDCFLLCSRRFRSAFTISCSVSNSPRISASFFALLQPLICRSHRKAS